VTATTLPAAARPVRPSQARRNLAIGGVMVLIAWSALTLGIDFSQVLELPRGIATVFYEMFLETGPDWSYLPRALQAMVESLQIAWVGTIIGVAISLPLGFFGAKNVSSGPVSTIVRQVLNGIRAFPEIVLAIAIFIPIAGLGPVAGALAIGLHSAGTLGKLTAEAIEGIDQGPVEAARAVGAGSLQVQRWGVVPQVLPEMVAFWLYRFEIDIRAAAVLGVVGAGGIGFVLQQTITFHRFPQAGTVIIVMVAATIAVDAVSGGIRRRIIEGARVKAAPETEIIADPSVLGGRTAEPIGRS
jgi:phosphonate transport system permease protein